MRVPDLTSPEPNSLRVTDLTSPEPENLSPDTARRIAILLQNWANEVEATFPAVTVEAADSLKACMSTLAALHHTLHPGVVDRRSGTDRRRGERRQGERRQSRRRTDPGREVADPWTSDRRGGDRRQGDRRAQNPWAINRRQMPLVVDTERDQTFDGDRSSGDSSGDLTLTAISAAATEISAQQGDADADWTGDNWTGDKMWINQES